MEFSDAEVANLPDSAFAYIQAGGTKDDGGRTTPRDLRHYPLHNAAATRSAVLNSAHSPYATDARFLTDALPKIKAAAKRFGINMAEDGRSALETAETERRFIDSPVECRASAEGERIGGYAAVFHTPMHPSQSRNLGGFVERVTPTAFNKARQDRWPGAICRYNHSSDMLLGTTAGNTLELEIDNLGLNYRVLPPKARADIVELVGRGDVQHSSFAFRVPAGGEDWHLDEDVRYPIRSLLEVQLVDVAPVLEPAYPDATAGLRSLAERMGVEVAEVRKMAEVDELRRFFVRTDRSSGAPPVKPSAPKPQPVLAAKAALELQARRFDPYIDEEV